MPSCSIFQNLWDPSQEYDALVNDNFASLFGNYSEMGVSFSQVSIGMTTYMVSYTTFLDTFNGTTQVSESYNVIYASPTTYKVGLFEDEFGTTLNATAWVQKDGDVVAYDYLGQNLTGTVATGIFQGLMSPFIYEADYNGIILPFTSGSSVNAESGGEAEIGASTVALTNYSAESLPLMIQVCGSSFTLSTYLVQTGQVPGATSSLLTLLEVGGMVSYNSGTYQISALYLQLTSVQKA